MNSPQPDRIATDRRLIVHAPFRRAATVGLVVAGAAVCVLTANLQGLLLFTGFAGIGAFLAWLRPASLIGWLLVLCGWGLAIGSIPLTASPDAYVAGSVNDVDLARAWANGSGWTLSFVAFVALTVLFPTSRLPRGRSGLAARVALVAVAVLAALIAFGPKTNLAVGVDIPNPFGVLPLGLAGVVPDPNSLYSAAFAAFVVGVGVLLARYRRSAGLERLQYRWFVAALVLVAVTSTIWAVANFVLQNDPYGLIFAASLVAYLAVPAAIAISVVRYRLYEIDRIVNRAIVYGAVTAILAGVFAAAADLSQRLFVLSTGETSDAAVILTTLIVATLYTPLRKRVEVIADRYFKYDQRLFGTYEDDLVRLLVLVEPSRAAARLARELTSELGATGAAVVDAAGALVASAGVSPLDSNAMVGSIRIEAAPLGVVIVGPRRDGRPHEAARLARASDIIELALLALATLDGPRRSAALSGQPSLHETRQSDRPEDGPAHASAPSSSLAAPNSPSASGEAG